MVKEYHNDFLHFVVDCKTGNDEVDKGVESAIKGEYEAVEDKILNKIVQKVVPN